MGNPQLKREIRWLLEEKYQGKLIPAAKKDITRLKRGEHVDYVIGFIDFAGCRIDLSAKPFIPRPETEYWIEKFIKNIKKKQSGSPRPGLGFRCLDLFAGSGCIGIAVLKHIPNTHVVAAEKEKKFCDQIKVNAKLNSIDPKRYEVIQADVFSGVQGKYDYIFANPPYIAESRRDKVQASVVQHEPQEALFAGKDGLDVISPFLSQAKDFLNTDGAIYLEFDSFQKRAIEKLLAKFGYSGWQFHKDQYGKWRFVKILGHNILG